MLPTSDLVAMTRAILDITRQVVHGEERKAPVAPTAQLPDFHAAPHLARLVERAGLAPLETTILRILIAAELERTAYRCLQRLAGDPTQAGVAVDALVAVVEAFGGEPVRVLQALRPEATLVQRGLVQIRDAGVPALVQRLTLSPRLVDYAIDGAPPKTLDRPLMLVERVVPVAALCPVTVRQDATPAAQHLRAALSRVLAGDAAWLTGPSGSGRKTLLAAVAHELGCRVLVLEYDEAARMPATQLVATLWREILLGDAILCIANADVAVGRPAEPESGGAVAATSPYDGLVALYGAIRRAALPVVFTSDQPPSIQALDQPPQVIRLGPPTPAATLALWRDKLPSAPNLDEIATRFRLPPGRIVRVAEGATAIARTADRTEIRHADIAQAVSVSVAQQVAVLGTLVEDTQTWDDMVLPDDSRDSVRELIARVRHRHTVLDEWGFRRKLSKGLGMAALFSGPPGTGKTMVASLIARELGQELYQIDLSRIVSKWIGETEKNLARVFDAAEGANVLLLFDEADALFAKRTEVKSSNDRHSNAEVNYLLQRVERFEGLCILTTNFDGSIDPAFKRRLAFRMIFPLPDVDERALLWHRMMPANAQLAEGVDYDELARDYELAGGNIRNAVLRAAFLAASEQKPIDQALLLRAVRLEYRDAGKLADGGKIT